MSHINTRYIETDALVCAMERCEGDAKEKLRQLTSRERKRLQNALSCLDGWIGEVDEESKQPRGEGKSDCL